MIYSLLAKFRRYLYKEGFIKKKKLHKPVISIGNLSVGGTGKTPLTIYISKLLQKNGYKVCVLSRGYKRKSKETLIVSDGNNIYVNWQSSGDEPYLIALNKIPVVVSKSRYEAGLTALKNFDVDIFILDDGFQHFQLYRDLDILLIDAKKPFWEDKPLPFGRLREPVETYKYTDIFVITKAKKEEKELIQKLRTFEKPFFFAKEVSNSITDFEKEYPLDFLKNKEIFLFSGLANNQQFIDYVSSLSKQIGFKVTGFKGFKDHFDYENFTLPKVNFYLTTEKDLLKVRDKLKNVYALKYQFKFPEEFDRLILKTAEKLVNQS